MQRILSATRAVDLFGVGKPGFKDGDLSSGILATDLTAAWFNGVQEELLAVIEAAGIAPTSANLTQLLLALRSAGVFQTQATNDSSTKAATTAFANPGSSLAASGYQKLPSGLILQWGSFTSSGAGTSSVSFPIAFPTACRQVFPVLTYGGAGTPPTVTLASGSYSTTGFNVGSTSSLSANYLAIGN